MQKNIHPKRIKIMATCSCGNIFNIYSSLEHDISLDVCSACHPFYTGKQRVIDTGGRVDRFNRRFNIPIRKK